MLDCILGHLVTNDLVQIDIQQLCHLDAINEHVGKFLAYVLHVTILGTVLPLVAFKQFSSFNTNGFRQTFLSMVSLPIASMAERFDHVDGFVGYHGSDHRT